MEEDRKIGIIEFMGRAKEPHIQNNERVSISLNKK